MNINAADVANVNVGNGSSLKLSQCSMLGAFLQKSAIFETNFHKLATNKTLDADETQIPCDANAVILWAHKPC